MFKSGCSSELLARLCLFILHGEGVRCSEMSQGIMTHAVLHTSSLPLASRACSLARSQHIPLRQARSDSARKLVITAGIFDGLFGGGKGASKTCRKCKNKGAIPCPGCKGTGRNKKNGNMFERWKCYDCQGFGQITCPQCGGGLGLTPEQRRER